MFSSRHGSQEGLRQRMIADGATTFAKKVAWVRKHIPSVDDPQSFVGWIVAKHNPAQPAPPAGFARYRVLSSSWGADAVTHKRALLYTVKAPDNRTGNLIPHSGVYRFHEQLELFGSPVQEEFTLTAPVAKGSTASAPSRAAQQLGLFANPRRNPRQNRVSILSGELYSGDWDPDQPNYFKVVKYTVLDPRTRKPVPDLSYEGLAWEDPLDPNSISLDDPKTTPRPRMILIGKQTAENKEYGKGYDSAYFGKRRLSDDALQNKSSGFIDGYWQGSKDRPDKAQKRNPQVLTGAVREIPDGSGLGIKTFRTHGGKRKAEWLPVPANLPDWRADLAQGKRLSHPKGLRKSPFVQDVNNQKVSEAIAPNGQKVWVGWQVVDLSKLRTSHDPWTLQVNSAYPQELQPRDRSRKSYADQICRLVAQFDPALLVWSATISDGAPIVGDDGVVESGNGRTMALSRVYRTGGAKADEYRQAVKLWAAELGIPVPKVPHPVLVRVRQTAVDRAEFARMANVSAMQLMSAGEQAVTDAASMTADLILQLDPDRSVGAGANSGFVDGFIAQVAGRTARGQLVDEKGRLSKSGENRIDLAIFAFAYGAEAQILINELAEVRESDLRTALSGMLDGAARVARLRAGIAAGLYHAQHDPSDGLAGMANFVRAAKLAGQTVDQRLAQATMFEPLPRTSELWLQALRPKGSRLSAAALAAAIVAYCQWVDLYPAGQATMFGEQPPAQVELIQRSLRGGPEG